MFTSAFKRANDKISSLPWRVGSPFIVQEMVKFWSEVGFTDTVDGFKIIESPETEIM